MKKLIKKLFNVKILTLNEQKDILSKCATIYDLISDIENNHNLCEREKNNIGKIAIYLQNICGKIY